MQRFLVTALLVIAIPGLCFWAQETSLAQNPTPAPASSSSSEAGGSLILRAGTPVHLTFAQDISSKTAFAGDPVVLLLDSELKVDGVVVAKATATAYAEVANAQKSVKIGKPGQLSIRLDYLKVGNNKVRLRGTQNGGSGNDAEVALTEKFGPLGLIKHGNIDIKQGTPLMVYVANDIPLPAAR